MTPWAHIFLGAIAAATVVMAVIQVGAIVYAGRLARRVERLVDQVELELKPMFGSLGAIARDASRASSLAVVQVERVDELFGDLAQRLTQTVAVLQDGLMGPAREGRAVLSGLRAAFAVIRSMRDDLRTRSRGDDEDALFI
ncbi:MAG TPA: hypothetical protein VNE16_12120 [Vicinamibacterales bacterium]|nr:hypothetical protein [Vicinamibacterales bacterium]